MVVWCVEYCLFCTSTELKVLIHKITVSISYDNEVEVVYSKQNEFNYLNLRIDIIISKPYRNLLISL